jgi:multiple sugar transport system substrate-binding protein
MKKVLSILVSLVFIITLTACGSSQDKQADTSEKTEQKSTQPETTQATKAEELSPLEEWAAQVKEKHGGTHITALLASHNATTAMMEMIDEFTDLTGIKVETKVLASGEMKTMQRTNSSTKTGVFDVYMIDAFTIYEYAKVGYIENLNPYLKNPDMTPEWYDYEDILLAYREGIASVDGEAYALPIAGESRFIGYRKDLFEKYGKSIPKNLDELLELARFFKNSNENIAGITFRGAPGTLVGSAHMSIAYCFTDDPIINHKTGEFCVDSPETIESIKYLLELAKFGPDDIASYNHEDAVALFMQGKSAMWFDATSMAFNVEDPSSSTIAGKAGYFSVPEGPAGGSGAIAGWSLGIPTDSGKKDAAYAFIMYMTSREKAKEYNLNGGIPCRTSIFNDEEINAASPLNKFIYESVEAAGGLVKRGVVYNYKSPNVLSFMKIIGDEINRAMVGEITAEQAAANAQSAIEAALAEESK